MATELRKVGIVGAGAMGHGIAQAFAVAGFEVVLRDLTDQILERAYQAIAAGLGRAVEKGQLTAEAKADAMRRLAKTTRLTELRTCDLVVESIVEVEESKCELFDELGDVCRPEAILASNTGSVSITTLGRLSKRADKVVGMHFAYPAAQMKLVEVVRGRGTSDDTIQTVKAVVQRLDKTPVVVNDLPGFVSNRILMTTINEACFCLMEGVADRDAIDAVMKLGLAQPMGPLAMADAIGLDACLALLTVLHRDLGDPKYRPCPLLRQMVRAGQLGRKSGRGFYEHQATR